MLTAAMRSKAICSADMTWWLFKGKELTKRSEFSYSDVMFSFTLISYLYRGRLPPGEAHAHQRRAGLQRRYLQSATSPINAGSLSGRKSGLSWAG